VSDTSCPEPELWVRHSTAGRANSNIEVRDHLVRSFDSNQIVVGSFVDLSPVTFKQCFIGRLNTIGEIVESTYVKHKETATQTTFYESECLSVAINYFEDEIVTVGYYQQKVPAPSNNPARRMLIIKSFLKNGLGGNDIASTVQVATFN
jgi:hypothetical protein